MSSKIGTILYDRVERVTFCYSFAEKNVKNAIKYFDFTTEQKKLWDQTMSRSSSDETQYKAIKYITWEKAKAFLEEKYGMKKCRTENTRSAKNVGTTKYENLNAHCVGHLIGFRAQDWPTVNHCPYTTYQSFALRPFHKICDSEVIFIRRIPTWIYNDKIQIFWKQHVDESDGQGDSAFKTNLIGGVEKKSLVDPLTVETKVVTVTEDNEDEKLKKILQAIVEKDQKDLSLTLQNTNLKRKYTRTVHPNYICYKCNLPGHHITECLDNNNDGMERKKKRKIPIANGIVRKDLMLATPEEIQNWMSGEESKTCSLYLLPNSSDDRIYTHKEKITMNVPRPVLLDSIKKRKIT